MSESKVKMKVEQEIKPLKKLCEKMVALTDAQLAKGAECIDAEELGEVIDMIKDLAEAKKETVEACYKMQIMEAMEGANYSTDYNEMGRIKQYIPMSDGHMYFTYPEMMTNYPMRDMDREYGRMYYGGNSSSYSDGTMSGSNGMSGGRAYAEPMMYEQRSMNMPNYMRDYREGRSPMSRRSYMESKEMHQGKEMQMKELEKYMKELSQDITEMINDATPEEKVVLQQKLMTLAEKVVK